MSETTQQDDGSMDCDEGLKDNDISIEASLVLREPQKPALLKKKKKRTIREGKFGDSLVIRREDGSKIFVPVEASDNRNANMVVSSMMRDLIKHNIDLYKQSSYALKPKELADLAAAAKSVAEMSYKAYEPAEGEGVPKSGSGENNGLLGGMRAIGEGMGRAMAKEPKGFVSIMQELDRLGRENNQKTVKDAKEEIASPAKEEPIDVD